MASAVKPIPEGYHSVTPYLIVKGGARAIEFYERAFGARELFRMMQPDGRVGHAEMEIGDSRVMLADEHQEIGARSPHSIGGSPVTIPRNGLWPPGRSSRGRWRTSSTATETVGSPTPSATYGSSRRTRRTCRRRKWTVGRRHSPEHGDQAG